MRSLVDSIRYYSCGYCTNNLGLVFRGRKREIRKFPAGVFLIHHKKYGYILFDTGYSAKINKTGLIGRLYNVFNPTVVKRADMICEQLKADGISPGKIKTILLSHLHPDHIGGLEDFKESRIVLSDAAMARYRKPKIRSLIMKDFFPANFDIRADVISSTNLHGEGYDMFGDGSIVLIELNGHADGQMCALVNRKVLLAADSCWGKDLLDDSLKMKFPASLIQDNMKEYRRTIKRLQKLQSEGIELLFSHDTYDRKELL